MGEHERDPGDPRSGLREESPLPPRQRPHTEDRSQRAPGPGGTAVSRPPGDPARRGSAEPGDIHVVWRRIFQYIVDSVASGLLGLLAYAAFAPLSAAPTNADGSIAQPGLAGLAAVGFVVATVALALVYWVLVPAKSKKGQTLGMMLLGIRVVREDGSRVSATRHFVRMLLLIIDGLLSGLVGLAIILGSRRNRRLGDMAADTLVVRARG